MRLFPHAGAGDILAMEAEGDVVRHQRPAKFLKCPGIQSEQERRATLPVKDHCEDHTFVFARRTRGRYEHRLAGIRTLSRTTYAMRHGAHQP